MPLIRRETIYCFTIHHATTHHSAFNGRDWGGSSAISKNKPRGILGGAGIGATIGMLGGFLIGTVAVSDCSEFLCELDALGYVFGGMLLGAGVGAGIGALYPLGRWVRVDLPVQAGFPPYRTPFHETFVFRLLSVGLGIALAAIIN